MEQQSTVYTQHPLHRTGSCKTSKAAPGSDSQGLLSAQVVAAQCKQYPESQLSNKYNCCFTLYSPTQETKDKSSTWLPGAQGSNPNFCVVDRASSSLQMHPIDLSSHVKSASINIAAVFRQNCFKAFQSLLFNIN